MMEINEADTFLYELKQSVDDDLCDSLWQVDADAPFDKDGVAAFVLATDLKQIFGG